MFYSVYMATKTSILVEDEVWRAFKAYARSQGRSTSKQMEWLMREAVAGSLGKVLPMPTAPDVKASGHLSSRTRARSSG